MVLSAVFKEVLLLSLMGSILALGILAIKAILRQRLSAKLHYYIWFLLVLRLILPIGIQSHISLLNFIPNEQKKPDTYFIAEQYVPNIISRTIKTGNTPSKEDHKALADPGSKGAIFNYDTAAVLWIIGVSAALLYILCVNILMLAKLKKCSICEREDLIEILEVEKSRLKVNSKVKIIYSNYSKSPAVYGMIRPKILLPEELIDKLTPEEFRFVFSHELTHIKNKDLAVNTLLMVVKAIYWFNPLIWYALNQIKQDCEMACDAGVLNTLKTEEVKKYGQTMINILRLFSEKRDITGTLGYASKYNKKRIIMITRFKKSSAICAVLAVFFTIMVGCSSTIKQDSSWVIANKNSGTNNSTPSVEKTSQDEATQSNTTQNHTSQASQNNTTQDHTSQASQNNTTQDHTSQASQNNTTQDHISQASQSNPTQDNTSQASASNNHSAASSSDEGIQRKLLSSIMQLAKQGKIINSEFPVKTTVIEDVEKKLGNPDKVDWVPNANGNYAVFSKYNVVFGFNKGEQIFEARSFDTELNELSLSMVKKEYGTPAYDVKSNGEEIIGYVVSSDYKILLVFPQPSNSQKDPVMDHYSVLYPRGTVNNMANYPGRQW
ncbi:M56 family metallopeptidase [Neobacillus dielmonensis]|uniref:M56 family metallopeptidase n=1 Tax=Neobacillus dielmonensis TaxID=1347369 RepID=UPI0005A60E53|nr:M56 family metallopeptidase [Neobacillus dielmonensis]